MILNGSYSDNTKELIESFDNAMNEKNAELESAQAEAAQLETELTDAINGYTELGVDING